jgi:hypothetical protein
MSRPIPSSKESLMPMNVFQARQMGRKGVVLKSHAYPMLPAQMQESG